MWKVDRNMACKSNQEDFLLRASGLLLLQQMLQVVHCQQSAAEFCSMSAIASSSCQILVLLSSKGAQLLSLQFAARIHRLISSY